MPMRLAIVTTHPIQYNAPWFRMLAQQSSVSVKVFYTWEAAQSNEKYDPGFKRVVAWDIPLLDGYEYVFVKNVAVQQGSHHFKGIDNPTLIQEIKDWQAEAVLVIGWAYKSHLSCMRYFKGRLPVIFRGDSTLLDEQTGIKTLLRRLALRFVYRHIDYALYVGENNRQYFKVHGVGDDKLIYAPHAIDNDRFADNKYRQEADNLRKQLNIAVGDFVILFAGKLEKKKNPAFLLELSKRITNDNVRFVIAGNGEQEGYLRQQTANDKRFVFLGFCNQQMMPAVYNLADVFVLPSTGPNETWGLAVNEAMACAKPVIATDKVGGAIDLIKDNGIIIATDGYDDAVKYINKLREDTAYLHEQQAKSVDNIKHFTFKHIVDNITSLVERIKTTDR